MGMRRQRERGYTLIELMVVVAIIGVLATIATYGVRKYVLTAKTAEPIEMINSVRAAQEAFKDETFGYLSVSPMTSYYPFGSAAALGNSKKAWSTGSASEKALWDQLGVMPSTAVQFGYACTAGKGSGVPTDGAIGVGKSLGYPASATDWYVVRAAGDRDANGTKALFVGSSFSDLIYGENEAE